MATANAEEWRGKREQLNRRIEELGRRGICYSCLDLKTHEVFGDQQIIHEDDLFKVVLDPYPRMKGHTIVVYKPHREDISHLSPGEVNKVFRMCVRVVQAIKKGLGAEKVYLNTMCDGPINHLHLQLFPRYPGDPIGSKRFVAERGPLVDGPNTARLIQGVLEQEE